MTYESIKRKVNASLAGEQIPAWVFFTIGAIAKTIATTATYPLQLVQSKLRVILFLIINTLRKKKFFFFAARDNFCTLSLRVLTIIPGK